MNGSWGHLATLLASGGLEQQGRCFRGAWSSSECLGRGIKSLARTNQHPCVNYLKHTFLSPNACVNKSLNTMIPSCTKLQVLFIAPVGPSGALLLWPQIDLEGRILGPGLLLAGKMPSVCLVTSTVCVCVYRALYCSLRVPF